MEKLIHYVWKHKMYPLRELNTTFGEPIDVIDTGLYNRNAGPDFFNAKIKIDNTLWVGNVEIHEKASDWYAHGHHLDAAYNNTVLHVCRIIDSGQILEFSGGRIRQRVCGQVRVCLLC